MSVAPELVIVKNLDDGTTRWAVGTTAGTVDFTDYLELDTSAAAVDAASVWNDTDPTSSVFSVGSDNWTNKSTSNLIAYCFHSVEGYSKVGSYIGNTNADGTFVYLGFKPGFLLLKEYDNTDDWGMYDDKRKGYNDDDGGNQLIYTNYSQAEEGGTTRAIDLLSNGFKLRTSNATFNGSKYIYLAFAESPFKYSNAR